MLQDSRKVLWVVDEEGNFGKSFLANFLNILYGFLLLDGTLPNRDVALFLDSDTKGIIFDISRDAHVLFNYATVEALKNGYISSGKYSGRACRFDPVKIVVFCNNFPDRTRLSRDRWDILALGEGELNDISKIPIVSPEQEFAFIPPPDVPDLTENFSLRNFLYRYMPRYAVAQERAAQQQTPQLQAEQQPPHLQAEQHQQLPQPPAAEQILQPPTDQPPADQELPQQPENQPQADQQLPLPPADQVIQHYSQSAGQSTDINLTQPQREMTCQHNCNQG